MTASIWSPGDVADIETVNADRTRKAQRFTNPAGGQTVFNLTNFAYAVGTGSLQVNINGVQQYPIIDFQETSVSSFTMTSPVESDDVIDAFGLVGSPAAQAAATSAAFADASAITAAQKATDATASYNLAYAAQLIAQNKASEAAASAVTAGTSATNAANTATTAVNATLAQKVTDAQAARDTALGYKDTALTYQNNAYQYKLDAAASAQTASNYAAAAGGSQLNADWNEASPASKAYIVNKPSLAGYVVRGGDNNTGVGTGTKFISTLNQSMANILASGLTDSVPLRVGNTNNGAAVIQLIRDGIYGAYIGLDTDNQLKYGGFTVGNVAYKIYHEGNFTPTDYYKPAVGGDLYGQLRLTNANYLAWKNTSGTPLSLIGLSSANNLDIYVPTPTNQIRFMNSGNTRANLAIGDTAQVDCVGKIYQDVTVNNPGVAHEFINTNGSGVTLSFTGNGSTPVKYIRVSNGNMAWLNSALSANIMVLTDGGTLSAPVITQTSDERKKKDWVTYESDLIEQFAAITKIGSFTWKGSEEVSLGAGAQSMKKIKSLETAIERMPDNSLTVNTGGASLVLIHALCTRLLSLEAELKTLKENK